MATAPKSVPKAVPATEGAASASKQPAMMLIIIAVLLLVIIGGGGAGAWYFFNQKGASGNAAPKAAAPARMPVFLAIEQFTVNLQPEVGEQYLQVSLTLEISDQQQADLLKTFMPVVRSRLLLLLSSKKASELSTPDGKKKLQDDIIAAIKQPFRPQMSPAEVSSVSFTAFIIQ